MTHPSQAVGDLTPSSADLTVLLVRVEAAETRMKGLRDTKSVWAEGYAHGAAEAYGVIAADIRALIASSTVEEG